MAGKPKTRAAHAVIEAAGGEDVILRRIAGGETISAIARDIGVSRPILSQWCRDGHREPLYARAKQEAAAALVESGLEIVEAATPTDFQVAKLRADYRRYLAAKMNPAEYGERIMQDVRVLDITAMHVEQLRGIVPGMGAIVPGMGNSVGNSDNAIDVTPVTSTTYEHDTADDASADSDDSA